jgi:hypothetical protein
MGQKKGRDGRKKAPAIDGRGKLAERLEVEFGPFRSALSRERKCLLVAQIPSRDLFVCAKELLVDANGNANDRRAKSAANEINQN